MSAEKVFTVQTRIRMNNEIFQYLSAYMAEYNRIYRYAWHIMTSPDYSEKMAVSIGFCDTYTDEIQCAEQNSRDYCCLRQRQDKCIDRTSEV